MWNVKFNLFLIKFGLSRSEFDSCVYFCRNEKDFLIVAIFADDGLVCASITQLTKNVIDFLSEEFYMRSLPATEVSWTRSSCESLENYLQSTGIHQKDT
jgi:hypothetical protein